MWYKRCLFLVRFSVSQLRFMVFYQPLTAFVRFMLRNTREPSRRCSGHFENGDEDNSSLECHVVESESLYAMPLSAGPDSLSVSASASPAVSI
jgi:hypothetical protein